MKTTTLALIGAGKWGQNYLHTAAGLNNIEIKYICARSQQTLDLFPNTYTKTLSINSLLKNKQIDGFIIATPANTHFEITKQLLSLGQNILIEKPLTIHYNQALELQRIWKLKRPQVLIGHTYLYNPAYQALKKIFRRLNQVNSIHFEGVSSHIRKDVSVIWDWGPHPISILLDLIQQPIVKIVASGSINNPDSSLYDTVNALIRFGDNTEASIDISWLGQHKIRRLIIKGTNEVLELDDTNVTHQKVLLNQPNMPSQYPKYNSETPLTNELIEFVAAIQDGKLITSDINMGVNVVKVLSDIEHLVGNQG